MTKLKHRKVTIDTYKANMEYLHRDYSLYQPELLSILVTHAEMTGGELL